LELAKRLASGFSLIEMMIAITILATCTALTVPALRGFARQQRARAAMDLIIVQMAEARTAAVINNQPVVVCPAQPQAEPADCSGAGDWSAGWILFLDHDGDRRPSAASDIIDSTNLPADRGLSIRTSQARAHVRYLPDGRSAGSNLTFELCNDANERIASVVLNNAGRTRSQWAVSGLRCEH